MKTLEQQRARALRASDGLSIKEIANSLGVSTSSVSVWVRDVELTPAQHEMLAARNPALTPAVNGAAARARQALQLRLQYQQEGRELARAGDPLFVAGCMLYWAEGGKSRTQLRFVNSDPEMLALFMRFLRTYFAVEDEAVRVTCHLFADHAPRQREVEDFWLHVLGLPRTRLGKSMVNTYSKHSKKLRTNKLPYGTCRIVVSRTRLVQMVYGAIQELAGFERSAWAES